MQNVPLQKCKSPVNSPAVGKEDQRSQQLIPEKENTIVTL